jgi:hypothetical protein
MLYVEVITVCCKNHVAYFNTLRGQNSEFLVLNLAVSEAERKLRVFLYAYNAASIKVSEFLTVLLINKDLQRPMDGLM